MLRDSVAASRPRGLELLLLLGGEPVKPEEGGDNKGVLAHVCSSMWCGAAATIPLEGHQADVDQ